MAETKTETEIETETEAMVETKAMAETKATPFGFILTRHVRDEKTNLYWQHSVSLLRKWYPHTHIKIIDDHSPAPNHIHPTQFSQQHAKWIQIIPSEYDKGKGEWLPYIYYLKHPEWFPLGAIILHDSTFIHARWPFEKILQQWPVLPLWHCPYNMQRDSPLRPLCERQMKRMGLHPDKWFATHDGGLWTMTHPTSFSPSSSSSLYSLKRNFPICFGAQCIIRHSWLQELEQRYHWSHIGDVLHDRADRCAWERVLGWIIILGHHDRSSSSSSPSPPHPPSLLGNILSFPNAFHYTYNDYLLRRPKHQSILKVWTGR